MYNVYPPFHPFCQITKRRDDKLNQRINMTFERSIISCFQVVLCDKHPSCPMVK